ncbi:MAG: DUF3515 family protein [Actinomycetes bacterium]
MRAAAVVLIACSLSGCSDGDVTVRPPTPTPVTGVAASVVVDRCTDLTDHLPATVVGQKRRQATPRSPLTAAWGDPPVTLRCGVAASGPTTEQCVAVDGVDWLIDQTAHGYRFLSYGRRPAVEVVVPDAYQPEVNALVDLAAAVARLPKVAACS